MPERLLFDMSWILVFNCFGMVFLVGAAVHHSCYHVSRHKYLGGRIMWGCLEMKHSCMLHHFHHDFSFYNGINQCKQRTTWKRKTLAICLCKQRILRSLHIHEGGILRFYLFHIQEIDQILSIKENQFIFFYFVRKMCQTKD